MRISMSVFNVPVSGVSQRAAQLNQKNQLPRVARPQKE